MLTITDTALEITNRFFEALEVLQQRNTIRGLQTFTKMHNLNYGNMNTLKNNRKTRQLKSEYLAFLCNDFNVSAEWLLLGKGNMFNA